MHWIKISMILCMFGCLKDCRPSESFVTDYLTGHWKNFTRYEVNIEIYPVGTYSYALTLVIIFLITDFVRYKPIIILCGISGFVAFILMIFGTSVIVLQMVEFFYGLFLSAEIAYYTYIYAKVEKKYYQQVTSHTKAASLIGRFLAGVIAQLTTSFDILDYHQLNYITVSAFALATIWTFFLPSVGQSIYFHAPIVNNEDYSFITKNDKPELLEINLNQTTFHNQQMHNVSQKDLSTIIKIKRAYILLWKHFIQAFTNAHVLKWSIWWAFSTCGYLQIANYAQLLWQTTVDPNEIIYNGAIDSIYAIIGAFTVFCVGKIALNWTLVGDLILSIFAFMEGGLILFSSYNYNIWTLYGIYIIFGVIYHTMVTVASFEVAKYVSEDSYGLIFGANIFFALILESLLTLIFVNGSITQSIRSQFFAYGCYFLLLAVIFTVIAIFTIIRHYRSGEKFNIWVEDIKDVSTVEDLNKNKLSESFKESQKNSLTSNDVILVT